MIRCAFGFIMPPFEYQGTILPVRRTPDSLYANVWGIEAGLGAAAMNDAGLPGTESQDSQNAKGVSFG